MMFMFDLIIKKCKFLGKFKIDKNIYLDFDMAFPVSNFFNFFSFFSPAGVFNFEANFSNFEALVKTMQMEKGICPWGLALNLS